MTTPTNATNKPTIHIDVDGVLADLVTDLCIELGLRGHSYTSSDIKHFDFKLSMSKDAHLDAMDIMGTPGFCHGLGWYDGAKNFLRSLQEIGDVTALTSPFFSPTWRQERETWLYPEIRGTEVLSVPSKHKPKVRGDILIEDHPGTLAKWLDANPDSVGILINRPWNQVYAAEYTQHQRMVRAFNFDEALFSVEYHVNVSQQQAA